MSERPTLVFYHPKPTGNGAALSVNLHPARIGLNSGYIFVALAPQKCVASRYGTVTFPKFGWEEAIVISLDFVECAKVLQVFHGERESLEDGKGLFHKTVEHNAVFELRHVIDPVEGYQITARVFKSGNDVKDEDRMVAFFLTSAEALGLKLAIECSMASLAFGVEEKVEVER